MVDFNQETTIQMASADIDYNKAFLSCRCRDGEKKVRAFKGDDKLFGNDSYKRSPRDVVEEREGGFGRLHDFWHSKDVTMRWENWHGPYEDDMLFKLQIRDNHGSKEVILSKEEILRWLRYV